MTRRRSLLKYNLRVPPYLINFWDKDHPRAPNLAECALEFQTLWLAEILGGEALDQLFPLILTYAWARKFQALTHYRKNNVSTNLARALERSGESQDNNDK